MVLIIIYLLVFGDTLTSQFSFVPSRVWGWEFLFSDCDIEMIAFRIMRRNSLSTLYILSIHAYVLSLFV